MTGRRIAVVLSGFPRRSETFVINDLVALETRGLLERIFATKAGDGAPLQPGSERLLHRVEMLPPDTPDGQAASIAIRLSGTDVAGVHAYFAHRPAQVAAAVARALKVPFGFSVHARDARKVSREELAQRGRAAACVVACNSDVAGDLRRWGVESHLVPHGVDLERFCPRPSAAGGPLRLLAVGRLVPKKGFDVLLQAATRLSVPYSLRIVGEGSEGERLRALVAGLALGERVSFVGGVTHAALPSIYAEADAVVVPSIEDRTGDRDGLPNVVLEAMACGRAVVASDVGAIGSAITTGHTGLLVPPGDVAALASALEAVSDPRVRGALGREARSRAEHDYELGRCTDRLHRLLVSAYA
jgi:glycosyltransferase involved in cell wall biosynthesis